MPHSLDLISKFWVVCFCFPFQAHSFVQFSISSLHKTTGERKRHTVSVITLELPVLLRVAWTQNTPRDDLLRAWIRQNRFGHRPLQTVTSRLLSLKPRPEPRSYSTGTLAHPLTLHSFDSLTPPQSHVVSGPLLRAATPVPTSPLPLPLLSAKYPFKRRKKQQEVFLNFIYAHLALSPLTNSSCLWAKIPKIPSQWNPKEISMKMLD